MKIFNRMILRKAVIFNEVVSEMCLKSFVVAKAIGYVALDVPL